MVRIKPPTDTFGTVWACCRILLACFVGYRLSLGVVAFSVCATPLLLPGNSVGGCGRIAGLLLVLLLYWCCGYYHRLVLLICSVRGTLLYLISPWYGWVLAVHKAEVERALVLDFLCFAHLFFVPTTVWYVCGFLVPRHKQAFCVLLGGAEAGLGDFEANLIDLKSGDSRVT